MFKDIYLYLFVALATSIINGVVTGIISKRRYNHKYISKELLSNHEKKELVKDVGSLSVYKLCRTLDTTVDTFLISKFISVATTAIYGSINMLLNAITDLLGKFNDGMIASVGDLYASKQSDKIEKIFYESIHFTFLMHGVCVAVLVPFVSHFLKWWIGYTLSDAVIYLLLLNFFMHGMSGNVSTFRNSMGLFRKGWKQPAITVALNLIFSIILVQKVGIIGTIIGTFLARTLTTVWFDPYVVCKFGFNKKPFKYYLRYIAYLVITFSISAVTYFISTILPVPNSLLTLILHGSLYLVCALILFGCFGFVFIEQKSVFRRVSTLLNGVFGKLHKKVSN